MSVFAAAMVLSWVAILLLAFGLSGVLRRIELLRQELLHSSGPLVGTRVSHNALSHRRPDTAADRILFFLDTSCDSCQEILPKITDFAQRLGDQVSATLVFDGPKALPESPYLESVVDREAFNHYNINIVPSAVALDGDNTVLATDRIGSAERLQRFLRGLGLALEDSAPK